MKKQVGFYILWDVLLFLALYIHYEATVWSKQLTQASGYDIRYDLLAMLLLPIILGGLIALLVVMSNRFEQTKKNAIAEFLTIGIVTLYIGIATFAPIFLLHWSNGPIPLFGPYWLVLGTAATPVGCLLFGYELVLLFTRLHRIKSNKSELEHKSDQ